MAKDDQQTMLDALKTARACMITLKANLGPGADPDLETDLIWAERTVVYLSDVVASFPKLR